MARIAGVDLPRDKKIQYALPYIYGIGPNNARKILAETGVSADARVRDLRDAEVARLRQVIERDYKVEGALQEGSAARDRGEEEAPPEKVNGPGESSGREARQKGRGSRGHRAHHGDV